MPDIGVGRADFPGGDATHMYNSIQKIFALPNETKIYVCHDYPPNQSRPVSCFATVKDHKGKNVLIKEHTTEEEFVKIRKEKDLLNTLPKLIFPSIQVNIRAGNLGNAEKNGTQYIKIPLNKF
jgi:glyoxylase-like metal-dependent hydrolase (beta-lactamase superfamily II)